MRELPLSLLGVVSVDDWAAELGRTTRAVQRWIARGLIPAFVVGAPPRQTYLLRVADVKAFTPPPVGRPPKGTPAKPRRKPKGR